MGTWPWEASLNRYNGPPRRKRLKGALAVSELTGHFFSSLQKSKAEWSAPVCFTDPYPPPTITHLDTLIRVPKRMPRGKLWLPHQLAFGGFYGMSLSVMDSEKPEICPFGIFHEPSQLYLVRAPTAWMM